MMLFNDFKLSLVTIKTTHLTADRTFQFFVYFFENLYYLVKAKLFE